MSQELAVRNETFMNIPVRIVRANDVNMLPLNDIADGICYDRSTLRKLFRRNERLLGKFSAKVIMASPQGIQETLCLNRDGVTGLLMKLDFERIKSEEKKTNIIAFQEWAIDTLCKVINGKTEEIKPLVRKSESSVSIGDVVKEQLMIADAMATYAHVDRGIATSMALSKVEFDTGADLKMWKNILPKEKSNKPIALLTPTEMGIELGFGDHSGKSVNKILNGMGFITQVGDHWALTQKGEIYGEAFPVTGIVTTKEGTAKSYARYQIKWQPKVLEMMKDMLFKETPQIQKGLLTGYI